MRIKDKEYQYEYMPERPHRTCLRRHKLMQLLQRGGHRQALSLPGFCDSAHTSWKGPGVLWGIYVALGASLAEPAKSSLCLPEPHWATGSAEPSQPLVLRRSSRTGKEKMREEKTVDRKQHRKKRNRQGHQNPRGNYVSQEQEKWMNGVIVKEEHND